MLLLTTQIKLCVGQRETYLKTSWKENLFTEPSKYDTSYLREIFELYLKASFSFFERVHACVEKTDESDFRIQILSKKISTLGKKGRETNLLFELLQCVL